MLNVAVRHDAPWEPPTFADTVFEVGDQACLEIGIDATSVASLGFEANLPDDGEQSRRHVATDASGSVDEMDACFEVGLQPEASAMIVFSVRNSRVTVMAEWLQTEHIPTGFKEETTEEPRRQIPTKSGNIGFVPGESMSCVRIVPKVSDHSLKRMHDGASPV